jgi:2-polyprenyl-6-methoxyphenol hydroxylase-like FAD-dependent oxidoreductase
MHDGDRGPHLPDVDCVIVGAGIGGSLLSLLLGRQGQRVVVVEANPGVPTRGAEFLKPRGIRMLAEHGLLADLRGRGALSRSVINFYHDGALILSYDFAEHTDVGHFLIVPYAETVGTILSACAELPNVDILFGSQVVDVVAEGTTVTEVILQDETRLRARAFVDSTGRSPLHAFVGPQRDTVSYDHVMRLATVPVTPSIASRNRLYFASDGWFAYFYPVTADSARVFVGVPRELEAPVFEQRSIDLTSHLGSFVTENRDALTTLDAGQFTPAPVSALTCKPYHRGNVMLLGGAAFAAHPMTGQGMSYTMEDATMLAEILSQPRKDGDLQALLDERYEARRSVHTELVGYGDELARSYHDRAAYLRAHQPVRHGGDL